jgi:hypothetical protein
MLKTLSGIQIIYKIILLDTFIGYVLNKHKILAQKHSHVTLMSPIPMTHTFYFIHIRMYVSTVLSQLLNF